MKKDTEIESQISELDRFPRGNKGRELRSGIESREAMKRKACPFLSVSRSRIKRALILAMGVYLEVDVKKE